MLFPTRSLVKFSTAVLALHTVSSGQDRWSNMLLKVAVSELSARRRTRREREKAVAHSRVRYQARSCG